MKQSLAKCSVKIGFLAFTAVSLNVGATSTAWVGNAQYDQVKRSDAEGEPVGLFTHFDPITSIEAVSAPAQHAGGHDITATSAPTHDSSTDLMLDADANLAIATPIPAAAWMFGSALLCFVGFATRKRKS